MSTEEPKPLAPTERDENALARFAETDFGKKALQMLLEKKGDIKIEDALKFASEQLDKLDHKSSADADSLIDENARAFIATMINGLIDIPIVSESREQILALKAVDVVADKLEGIIDGAGDVGEFFKDVKDLNPKKLDKWVESVAEDINGKVDLPMLNEDQEQGVIELVLKVVAEKFCGAGKKCLQGKSKWF
jgi:hypothetical protein